MSYNDDNYSYARKILANCDKCSAHGDSNKVNSIYGTIRMYKSNIRGRFYSVSKSTVPNTLPNCGSYRMSTLRERLMSLESCNDR